MGILDAPAVPARQTRVLQRDGGVPVANRVRPPLNATGGYSTGVQGGTSRVYYVATRSLQWLEVEFANWYTGAGPQEATPTNDILVSAALMDPTTGIQIPLRFRGQKQVVVRPDGTAVTDRLAVNIAKGDGLIIVVWVGCEPGGSFPINAVLNFSSDGHNYSTTGGADLTVSGAAAIANTNIGTPAFAPASIRGGVNDPGKSVVGIVGDSIFFGISDNSTGYAERGLGGNYSFQSIAMPGEALTQFIYVSSQYRRRRMSLLAKCGITHVITDYTVNSLSSATIQTEAVVGWRIMEKVGPTRAATLTPQTTSTDAWATVGNQTIMYPADREPRRVAFNNWLRDGAPINASAVPQSVGASGGGIVRAGQLGHPLVGYIEAADLAESARDSGKWKANYTGDGTHPNATGAAAIAASISANAAAWFGPASV